MPDEYDFDVAVSFAGEDRTLVADVVGKLKDQQVSVFYDQDFVSEMWGENLADYLHEVYRRRARFALIFISRHYVTRMWTRHERHSAQDRELNQPTAYLLPLRLDDTELPGLASTVGYLDAREKSVDEIVAVLLGKLGATRQEPESRFNGKVPRTPEELTVLLTERPAHWEFFLYAGVLLQEMNRLESKYQDHVLGFASRNGNHLTADQAWDTIERNVGQYGLIVEAFNRILDPLADEAAFGAVGDPDRIIHLARRLVNVYGEFMDMAVELRATSVSSPAFRRVLDIEARWSDQPIESIRSFAARFVGEMDSMIERVDRGEDVAVEIVIGLKMGDELVHQHDEAVKKLARELPPS